MSCKYCGGNGILKTSNTATIAFCQHCVNAQKLMVAIKMAMQQAKKSGDKVAYTNLKAINQFLPKYPVMAVLEAEARSLPESLITTLRKSFGIKKFA